MRFTRGELKRGESTRILPPRSRGTNDQIGPAAVAVRGGEAAEVDVFDDLVGEGLNAFASAVTGDGADGRGRAGDQGHQREPQFGRIARLAVHARFATVIAKAGGGDLAASVAVDAGFVHVELAFDIFGETPLGLSHGLNHPSSIHERIPPWLGISGQSTLAFTAL
jgi:hypothetical protein